ncbi:MAG TPA: HupE/UreJ family protein [Terriglobales bacterium]|nr:HupE/UreJ family protein [Terriglobales bacterium]
MLRRWVRFAATTVALTFASLFVLAHDLPTNTMMNAFVKIEPTQAHLVVRVPLDLLRGASFPMKGAQYDLATAGPATQATLKALAEGLPLWKDGHRLVPSSSNGRLSLPSDRSFEDYDHALQTAERPTDPTIAIYYAQGFLDAHFVYPVSSPESVFKIQTLVAADLGSLTRLTIRYLPLSEPSRAMMITGDSGPVALNPAWYQAGRGFVMLGIEHILSGIDHLLFLFCLVIPFRRLRGLIPVITAFTLAHSITLLGSAYHLAPRGAWFPPFVETAIAASIVYMALENIVGADLRRRWLITGMFGLVHGFGFSYALQQQLQFAGSHLLVSLFSFNVGIEIGQIFVLALMLPALALFRRLVPERTGVIILSALVAHTGWHWMTERWDVLRQTPWPRVDAAGVVMLARWVAGLLLAFGAAHLLAKWVGRKFPSRVELPERRMEQPERAA